MLNCCFREKQYKDTTFWRGGCALVRLVMLGEAINTKKVRFESHFLWSLVVRRLSLDMVLQDSFAAVGAFFVVFGNRFIAIRANYFIQSAIRAMEVQAGTEETRQQSTPMVILKISVVYIFSTQVCL